MGHFTAIRAVTDLCTDREDVVLGDPEVEQDLARAHRVPT